MKKIRPTLPKKREKKTGLKIFIFIFSHDKFTQIAIFTRASSHVCNV